MQPNKTVLPKLWGLFSSKSHDPVPLKNLDIQIEILHNIARVFYTQHYYNAANLLLETEFFFPISPDACFDSFEATFNSTTIKGLVKKKEKAREEYKQAVQQGKTAAYSEINQEMGDIMKVQIGNISPNTHVSIKYSYIQKLDVSLNKFWCFRLFSTITSRYNNLYNLRDAINHDIDILSRYPTITEDDPNAYLWKIHVEIQSPSPISYLKCPSHDVITTYGNENHTCSITLNPHTKHLPNKDFVLLYTNGKAEKVDYLLTPFEDGYCAMVTLLADFEKNSSETAFNNFVKAKEVENSHSMNTIRGEYIFLIDRSGSMSGERIVMAKESLVLFLKSLPQDSYFNVVSFGSKFELLHSSSMKNSQQVNDTSISQVENFSADLGGTEIYEPLEKIFNSSPIKSYPRYVFLITDGDVTNTQQVLKLIMANNDKARTFTIGIGNGCSPELIKKGALYGHGKEEFVSENSQIYEKVINLLNASLSPCYSDLSLHSDNFDAVVKSVSPNPASLPPLINGQNVTFFLFLRPEAFEHSQKMDLQLRLYDSTIGKHRTIDVTFDQYELFDNQLIPKLAIHDMIKRLESQKDQIPFSKNNDIMWMSEDNLKQSMLEYSLKYGILCKETAFFCVVSDINNNNKNLPKAKVIIPTLNSADYNHLESKKALSNSQTNVKHAFAFANPIMPSKKAGNSDISPIKVEKLTWSSCGYASLQKNQQQQSYQTSPSNYKSVGGWGMDDDLVLPESNSFKSQIPKLPCSSSSQKPVSDQLVDLLGIEVNLDGSAKKEGVKPSNRLYIDVIKKQRFEGSWDPNDQSLLQAIMKDTKQFVQKNAIWITILVLRWLEIVCASDRKAWLLIYQKGQEWLKSQNVDYEAMRDSATPYIKI